MDLRTFLTFRLARLQAQINSQAQHILQAHSDVGQSEWRVMILIEDRGESTMAHVVRDGQMDKAQVSRAVKTLQKKGYVTARVDTADHRQSILSLTTEGRVLHNRVLPLMRARQKHLMAGLSADEIEVMFDLIERLETAAQRRDF
ncbi:MAG: MarR family transcriptional regulator [Pseudomonadota bacterium]